VQGAFALRSGDPSRDVHQPAAQGGPSRHGVGDVDQGPRGAEQVVGDDRVLPVGDVPSVMGSVLLVKNGWYRQTGKPIDLPDGQFGTQMIMKGQLSDRATPCRLGLILRNGDSRRPHSQRCWR